MIIVN